MRSKIKSTLIFMILIACVILIGGCSTTAREAVKPSFTPETYPVIDGSTVTIPLSEHLAASLMNLTLEDARQYVLHNKTHQAYLNLIDKKADLIFVTSPSAEELEIAKEKKVELEVIPIVSEAFVFLTGKDNPVSDLSLKDIQRIYIGEVTNWKAVGGEDIPIIAYQRPVNSGSQTGFIDLVMKGRQPMGAPSSHVIAGMGELIDTVAAYTDEPNGLGYSYYYYASEMWGNEKVKLLSIDGVSPNNETISSREYPIHTAYYAVFRKEEAQNSDVRKIVSYILSKDGQDLMEEAGYVKVQADKK